MSYTPIKGQPGERIILDTDICTDCDDVAALALLASRAKEGAGAFTLAGVAANVCHPAIPAAVSTVISFHGLEGVLIGMAPEPQPWDYASKYLDALAAHSPGFAHDGLSALDLYRRVLSEAPDGSVTVVSIGFFNNLDAALRDNPELFRRKVRRVVAMAGGFGARADHREYNIIGHLDAARRFIRDFGGELVFVGFECGEQAMTDLTGFPEGSANFLLEAFERRSNCGMRHPSWDPVTVDFAIDGENECYRLSEPGTVEVDADGRTVFTPAAGGNARHLTFPLGNGPVSERISRLVRKAARLEGNVCRRFDFKAAGPIGRRIDAVVERQLASADIEYITAPFASHNERSWRWQTEFWGKFMHSAEPFAAYSGNKRLRETIALGVRRILDAQEASGYIGNYPDELRCGEGWDVWGMKYTLMGLIHHFDATGDQAALDAAKRLCDYVIAEIGPSGRRGRELWQTGNWAGYASSSILEPVVWLFRRTGEAKYMDFAGYIVRGISEPEGGPRLIDLALRGVHVADRNGYGNKAEPNGDYVSKNNRWKAYEMMSCYQGLIDYQETVRETGAKSPVPVDDIVGAAIRSAEDIVAEEMNLAGGCSSSEAWFHGASKQHLPFVHMQEACVTVTWMRLLERLSALTGDPKWADCLERTFFNAYLAALAPDSSEFAGYTPLSGYRFHGQHHCSMHTDCCNANGPRGFLSFLRAAVRARDGEVVIDQYASGTVSAKLPDGRVVGFDEYARYPLEDWIGLRARTAGRYKLTVRVPAWCSGASVVLDGSPLPGVAPGYFTIDREWREGDSLTLVFPMPVKMHVLDHNVAFTRGPLLLARDSRLGEGPIDEVVRGQGVADGAEVEGAMMVRPPSDSFMLTVTLPLAIGHHHANPDGACKSVVKFCDYASAGNEWRPGNYYRTWFPVERYPWER